jgi:hypothetical protein
MCMSKLAAQLVNFDTPENLVGEPKAQTLWNSNQKFDFVTAQTIIL